MRIAIIAASISLFNCSSTTSTPTAQVNAITVTETEYSIALTPSTVSAGTVTLNGANNGKLAHEVVVFKTELDPAKMPTKADGTVDEAGAGVAKVEPEVEDLGAGQKKTATLALTAGNYVVLCNVGDHYRKGMSARLVVK